MMDSIGFFDKVKLLEVVQDVEDPGDGLVSTVMGCVKSDRSLLEYFVRNLHSAGWMKALHRHGFFSDPPSKGTPWQSWVEGLPLVNHAAKVPEVVCEVAVQTQSDNPHVYDILLNAIEQLPLDNLRAIWPTACSWFDRLQWPFFPQKMSAMASNLVEAGHLEEVREFLVSVLKPRQSSREETQGLERPEAIGLVDYHAFEYGLGSLLRKLLEISPISCKDPLETNLTLALRMEAKRSGMDAVNSYFWRYTIEPSSQEHHNRHADLLIDWLRNALESAIQQDPESAHAVIPQYLEHEFVIFRRLGLHLIGTAPLGCLDLAQRELFRPGALSDTSVHHEMFLMLAKVFPVLPKEGRDRVVSLLIAGPDEELVGRRVEWIREQGTETPPDEEIAAKYRDVWSFKRLWMIKDDLDEETRAYFEKLHGRLGDPGMPPEYLFYMESSTGRDEVAEFPAFRSMPAADVVDYVIAWDPPPGDLRMDDNNPHGLAAHMVRDMRGRWGKYLPELERLFTEGQFPVYSYMVLDFVSQHEGARRKAIDSGQAPEDPSFDWNVTIPLAAVAVQRWTGCSEPEPSIETGYAMSVRKMAIRIAEHACRDQTDRGKESRPEVLRQARALLLGLCDDPDPSLDDDQPPRGYSGHNDPANVAINHVRPSALRGLITYAYLRAKELGIECQPRWEDEVKHKITELLQDEASSVRSVLGQLWDELYWLDTHWGRTRFSEIFTDVTIPPDRHSAPWSSYLLFEGPRPETFDLMRGLYVRSIEFLATSVETDAQLPPYIPALGRHLGSIYIWDMASLGQDPLAVLYGLPPNNIHVAVAHSLNGADWTVGEKQQFWPRVKALWEYRVSRLGPDVREALVAEEMAAYSRWLGHDDFQIPVASVASLLKQTIGPLGMSDREVWTYRLLNYLAKEAPASPDICIELVAHIIEQHGASWWMDKGEMAQLLVCGTKGSADCRRKTEEVIHKLGEYGHHWAGAYLDRLR